MAMFEDELANELWAIAKNAMVYQKTHSPKEVLQVFMRVVTQIIEYYISESDEEVEGTYTV